MDKYTFIQYLLQQELACGSAHVFDSVCTNLKAVNVEVKTECLYDHCCPLPQRLATAGAQLLPTDRSTKEERETETPLTLEEINNVKYWSLLAGQLRNYEM